MKNLKTLLLIAVFTFGISNIANAQKSAHIDTEKLIANMPATKALKAEMDKLGKTYQDDIEGMAKKLEAKVKKYTAEQATQTQVSNEKRAMEVQQDKAKIEQFRQVAYQEMQKKQREKLVPILEKAQKAIQDVAAAKGIIYVFDSANGKGLIVFEKGEDIYNAVKTKLGF